MKKLFYAEISFSERDLEDITSRIIDEKIIKEDFKNKYLFYKDGFINYSNFEILSVNKVCQESKPTHSSYYIETSKYHLYFMCFIYDSKYEKNIDSKKELVKDLISKNYKKLVYERMFDLNKAVNNIF